MTQHVSIRRNRAVPRAHRELVELVEVRVPGARPRTWQELIELGAKLGVYRVGMTRAALEYALAALV